MMDRRDSVNIDAKAYLKRDSLYFSGRMRGHELIGGQTRKYPYAN
jgi:hypothetical protein